ncbi:hypothetical protein M3Y95_01109400 [Aphelenchoides besseyi]|nr:hypothetical protein M3Y95_01109400 [Aphelenchoides besseyi]
MDEIVNTSTPIPSPSPLNVSSASEIANYGNVYRINNRFSLALGTLSVSLLLYMIVFRPAQVLRQYRKMLITAVIVDYYMLFSFWWSEVRNRVYDGATIILFIGPANSLSPTFQWISVCIHVTAPLMECLILPVEFWYRYSITQNRVAPILSKLLIRVGTIVFLALIVVASVYSDYAFLNASTIDYRKFWYSDEPKPDYVLVTDLKRNPLAIYPVLYRRFLTISSFVSSIIIAYLSVRSLKKNASVLSNRSKQMLKQFAYTLYAKACIPLCLLVLPYLGLSYLTIVKKENSLINDLALGLLGWSPFFNSLSSILLIGHFRKSVKNMFKITDTSVQTVSTVSRQGN